MELVKRWIHAGIQIRVDTCIGGHALVHRVLAELQVIGVRRLVK